MQPELQGVVPVLAGRFGALQRSAVQWPNSLKQCAAVCNSLNMTGRWQVAGDAADFAAFKACEASFLVRDTIGTTGSIFVVHLQRPKGHIDQAWQGVRWRRGVGRGGGGAGCGEQEESDDGLARHCKTC